MAGSSPAKANGASRIFPGQPCIFAGVTKGETGVKKGYCSAASREGQGPVEGAGEKREVADPG
jgi:hypothetical protein